MLDELEEIKIGVAYESPTSRYDHSMPASQDEMAACTVEYISLPGWQQSIEVRARDTTERERKRGRDGDKGRKDIVVQTTRKHLRA